MNIYVDFDGVIVNTVKAIVSMYNEDFKYYKGFEEIDYKTVNTWNFEELTLADTKTIDHYFNRERFFNRLEFMTGAHVVLKELAKKHDVYVVSMGYSPNLLGKQEWLSKNMPFVKLIGCNYKEYPDKAHIDMSDGIFIDDSFNNLQTSNAKYRILYGKNFSWNEGWDGVQIENWLEIFNYINDIVKEEGAV